MKTAVDWLDGQTMTVEEAIQVLENAIEDGNIEKATLELCDDYIVFQIGDTENYPIHSWRLIRFRIVHGYEHPTKGVKTKSAR